MSNPLSIAVLISGNGSNLQAIIDESAHLNYIIKSVISNKKDAYGLVRAKRSNIETQVIEHQKYPQRDDFDAALLQSILKTKADLVILAGFMRRLGPKMVNALTGRILNIHPSLLPKYPGLDTYNKALAAGDTQHGCSIHFVTEILDQGPVIAQASFPIESTDTMETLKAKTQQLEHRLYPKVIGLFASGVITCGCPPSQPWLFSEKNLTKQEKS